MPHTTTTIAGGHMGYENMTAPCGLACFDCVVYLANADEAMRALVSKQFDIPPEKIGCTGCRNIDGKCPVSPIECSVYPCAQEKGVTFCCDCDEFPCDKLHPYADQADKLPHNAKVFNLCLIKKMGVDAWAKERARKVRKTYYSKKWVM